MIVALVHFFSMHGYGAYVFTAYGSVFAVLALQWIIPWRRLRNYLRTQQKT